MLRGQFSRCAISTSVSGRRYGSSVSRINSSNWSVPNGLRKQMRVNGPPLVRVSAVVVRRDGRPGFAAGEPLRGERLEQPVAPEPGELAGEELRGKRREQDSAAV